jgi:hypothetical protein
MSIVRSTSVNKKIIQSKPKLHYMRNLICIALLFFLSVSFAYAQATPKEAKDAFKKQYPYASKPKWKNPDENRFEVFFKIGDDKHLALYDEKGKRLEYGKELLSISEAPFEVSTALEKVYPNGKTLKIVALHRNNAMFYLFDVKANGTVHEVVFDSKGKEIEDEELK